MDNKTEGETEGKREEKQEKSQREMMGHARADARNRASDPGLPRGWQKSLRYHSCFPGPDLRIREGARTQTPQPSQMPQPSNPPRRLLFPGISKKKFN